MTDEREPEAAPDYLPIAPLTVRDAALDEIGRLEAYVDMLTPEQWARRSALPVWTLGDVVAHLAVTLSLYSRLVDAVLAGRGSGSIWRTVGKITDRVAPLASPALNAINSAIPRALDRALSMEVIKAQLATATRTLRASLGRVEPADATRPVHYRGSPWPLSFFMASVVDELAVHRWDMESVLDPAAHLSERARTILPSFFWSGTPFMLTLPKSAGGSVQVALSDPPTDFWWRAGSDPPAHGIGRVEQPTATIQGLSGAFVLVLAGRIEVEAALRTTSLRIEGDETLARAFLGGWRIL